MSLAPGLHSSQDASEIGVDRRPSELPVPCTRIKEIVAAAQ